MGLRQVFRFQYQAKDDIRSFLRSFSLNAKVFESQDQNFFVFSQLPGNPEFTIDFEIVAEGFYSERAGEYFHILGVFIEAITSNFGVVEIEDI